MSGYQIMPPCPVSVCTTMSSISMRACLCLCVHWGEGSERGGGMGGWVCVCVYQVWMCMSHMTSVVFLFYVLLCVGHLS